MATTLGIITERLRLPTIPLVIYTDSYFLYECLIDHKAIFLRHSKLDIIALRQSYKRHKITEIRWIYGDNNPADAFTKASPNRALERLIDSSKLLVRLKARYKGQQAPRRNATRTVTTSIRRVGSYPERKDFQCQITGIVNISATQSGALIAAFEQRSD
jgi:hypothetical protein